MPFCISSWIQLHRILKHLPSDGDRETKPATEGVGGGGKGGGRAYVLHTTGTVGGHCYTHPCYVRYEVVGF